MSRKRSGKVLCTARAIVAGALSDAWSRKNLDSISGALVLPVSIIQAGVHFHQLGFDPSKTREMAEIVGLKTVDLDLTTASGVAVDLAGQNLSDGQFVAGIETVFAQQNGLCALEVDLTNIDLFPQQ